MSFPTTFDAGYPSHPWAGISTNQRQWYDPVLRDYYMTNAIYNRFTTIQFDTRGLPDAESMVVSNLILPHGDFDPIGMRQLWMYSSRIDTSQRTLSLSRYGAKMAFHKHDQAVTYWQGDKYGGLDAICRNGLSHMMVEIMDSLARNAFLQSPYALYGSGSGLDFSDVDSYNERFSTKLIDYIHLGMRSRAVPYTQRENGFVGNIVAIISPGMYYDLMQEGEDRHGSNAWLNTQSYRGGTAIINNEVGTYHNTRFVVTNRAMLYNVGPITVQTTVTASASAGDGADNTKLVDNVRAVGQPSGVTKYIQVADVTGFAVNDIVSIHVDRTNAFGITNGADFRDGKKQDLRIIHIDTGNNRLVFDKPVMTDFTVDLGGSVYGYVTKARHIHTGVFLGGLDGVVQGVLQPPRIYTPDELGIPDDFRSIYRFTFDMTTGYTPWTPEVLEVWYGAGSFRYKGPVQQ